MGVTPGLCVEERVGKKGEAEEEIEGVFEGLGEGEEKKALPVTLGVGVL